MTTLQPKGIKTRLRSAKILDIKNIGNLDDSYLMGISLGEGTYGMVKKAKNRTTQNIEALKLVPVDSIQSEVEREFEIMFRLSLYPRCNRYIICYNRVFKAFYFKRDYYVFSMEFFDGKELFDLIDKKNVVSLRMSINIIRTIFRDLTLGLSYIHKNGIVHRDIKTNNIMFNYSGLRIVDFGFSCFTGNCGKKIAGTEMYFPPEKYFPYKEDTKFGPIDEEKSDIWAAGIILLEMLASKDLVYETDAIIEPEISTEKSINKIIPQEWPQLDSDLKTILLSSLKTNYKERSNAKSVLGFLSKDRKLYADYKTVWNFWLTCKEKEKKSFKEKMAEETVEEITKKFKSIQF